MEKILEILYFRFFLIYLHKTTSKSHYSHNSTFIFSLNIKLRNCQIPFQKSSYNMSIRAFLQIFSCNKHCLKRKWLWSGISFLKMYSMITAFFSKLFMKWVFINAFESLTRADVILSHQIYTSELSCSFIFARVLVSLAPTGLSVVNSGKQS